MAEVTGAAFEVGRYALRTFRVDYRRRELRALTQSDRGPSEWRHGTCVARCREEPHTHTAPALGCSCGVYGANSLHVLRQFGLYAHELVTVIAAEGDTIVGDRGLRTAYARVVAYWAPPRALDTHTICSKACPDARRFKDLDDMLDHYSLPRGGERWIGRSVPAAMSGFWCVMCVVAACSDLAVAARAFLDGAWVWGGFWSAVTLVMAASAWWHGMRLRRGI